jgi:Ankyrin repeats (many copies)
LETLRHCLPSSVRRTLDELPECLDQTYERVLREIKKPNKDHALRLLQCLVVATRPLHVEELAEVLAVDYNDAERIPKFKATWRWEDQEQALLSSCSSLIAIVDRGDDSRLVQFSHFSVKEFLTSPRLATPSRDVSFFHIALDPAHTIMAQACLSVLLRSDNCIDQTSVERASPLCEYAAQHWVTHAQFGSVSLRLRSAMEYIFDLSKPYFAAWISLYDIDTGPPYPSTFSFFSHKKTTDGYPLYYAALCGFQDLVEHLIVRYPQHVNTIGGFYMTPAVAALAGRHFPTAHLLHRHGSYVNPQDATMWSPLHAASRNGDLEMVRILVELKADINVSSERGQTPLHTASIDDDLSNPKVAQFLLEHGADPNARRTNGSTPLHQASRFGRPEIVRVLIEHGAGIDAKDNNGRTPLEVASGKRRDEVVNLLLEYCAK